MMKVLIADDEPLARARVRGLLAAFPEVKILGEAENGAQVLQFCQQQAVDLVLLDIAMPGEDGVNIARQLAKFDIPPTVVFCTAYNTYALPAFEVSAIDYLMKPIRPERLVAALEKVQMFLAGREQEQPVAIETERRNHLCVRLGMSLRLIPLEDIYYLLADEKYVVVRHAQGQDLVEESLKSLEEEFTERFIRIHRNCLVARDELVEIRRNAEGHFHALLRHDAGAEGLEISRRRVAELRKVLPHL